MGVLARKTRESEVQKFTLKENQIAQVKEFSAFICLGSCESGLIEIIPWICTSANGANILCFLILSRLGCRGLGLRMGVIAGLTA